MELGKAVQTEGAQGAQDSMSRPHLILLHLERLTLHQQTEQLERYLGLE